MQLSTIVTTTRYASSQCYQHVTMRLSVNGIGHHAEEHCRLNSYIQHIITRMLSIMNCTLRKAVTSYRTRCNSRRLVTNSTHHTNTLTSICHINQIGETLISFKNKGGCLAKTETELQIIRLPSVCYTPPMKIFSNN